MNSALLCGVERRHKPKFRASGIAPSASLAHLAKLALGLKRWLRRRLLQAQLECRRPTLPKKPIISIVDDDQFVRQSVKRLMKSFGYTVADFPSASDFLESPHLRETSCLIADVNMPGMSGVELYGRLVESGCSIPTILVTAYPDDQTRARSLNGGVLGYLTKPFREADLIRCVRAALDRPKPAEEDS
jgi:CheY-like chemotaxis protein